MLYRARKQNIFLKRFLVWLVQLFFKKGAKSKFSELALLFKHFFIKIQPNMSEQEKKNNGESIICLM